MTALSQYLNRIAAGGFLAHLATVAGFLLAFFLVARLMNERRAPANTFAWLLVIVFIPWLGVPLYLLLGGRKLRRMAKDKTALMPVVPAICVAELSHVFAPVAKTVAAAGGFEPVGGNKVRFLLTGEEDFAELERQILAAKRSIHIATFILSRDADRAKRIVELLAQRAREGVKVRLLLDALGCFLSSRGFVDPIREAGGEVGALHAGPAVHLARAPRTCAATARSRSLTGPRRSSAAATSRSSTWGRPLPEALPRLRRRDRGPGRRRARRGVHRGLVLRRAPAPGEVREDAQARRRPDPGRRASSRWSRAGRTCPGDPLYEGIVAMIQQAEHSLQIVTPYFIPDEVLLRSMIVKARAGCDVTLIVPAKSNHPVTDFARRNFTRELTKAGGHVLVYNGGMLHAKAIVCDERVALFGSPNFDLRSLFVNFEVGVLIYTEPEIAAVRAWIADVMTQCTPPVIRKRHLLTSIAEDACRLLAPIL